MMANLFSSFDPSTNFNLSLNWLSTIIGLFIIPSSFWLIPSRLNLIWTKIIMTLHKEFKILIGYNKTQGSTLIFISLFSLILFNNFLGLFPYIFTSTSHMTLTLSLALPLWLSFMIYGWINNTIHMFAHLVPQGTPPILMPFMVCIETISNIIRPGTLAIRLSANMIAGHLLMTLLGNTGPMLNLVMVNFLIFTQILLLVLETAVSIIQSYVFAILSTLYSSEVN
uniref:ATP synthase subunit a n=1 Tax=Apriona swainsoni TaxID=320467 RepID=A0A1P8C9V8_9CUCU|nr:ATP synthase F0 subunit 6 [Apriona swainsoni]YP_010873068.1 ATP synthase F0 subunit 6 [Batocera horsfieldi]APA32596.1 ATP synthase F0 subunit 6 [Apriona swainsoni]WGV34288.1 ATP synthase F0 subunit 6 [Batocera horsfieldi]